MDRRRFLLTSLAGALAAPLAAEAQQTGKIPRIGYLTVGPSGRPLDLEFVRGLRELGWVDGRNMVIEARYLAGRQESFPQAAAELAGLAVDVIVAWSPLAVAAARKATSTIPIVGLSMGDPVRTGLAASLARPGGNVTGVANLRTALTGKWLELLREIVPGITRLAVLSNPANLDTDDYVREVDLVTRSWKAESKFFNASVPEDIKPAFAAINKWRPGGLLVIPDAMFWSQRQAIVELTGSSRLPAVYWSREYSDVGGLVSYAPSLNEMARRGSVFVDKILRGAKPADLPIEQPTTFELIINLKTAKALGLTIPPSLLARADQVIE
jgi:putative tryptophan/tyrosine transport system substrate-binding protein